YMLAVKNASNPNFSSYKALGAFYMPVEVSPVKSTIEKLSEKAGSFNYKAKGIFNGEVFQELDGVANSGWSRFYNFQISSKDGQYGNYGKSGVLRPVDFEKALKFTEKKIIQFSEEIFSGKVDVKPYRLNQNSPCSYCEYKSVCRFDWQVNEYNFLESSDKLKTLEKIQDNND
ncbi:MAG: PD-(D/E)XK nuclease family protein, partial [Phycisphaerae bacterium]